MVNSNKKITMEDLAEMIGQGFLGVDEGLEKVENRLDKVESRLGTVEIKLNGVIDNYQTLEPRVEYIENVLNPVK